MSATIEIEDLNVVSLEKSRKNKNNLTDIESMLFSKENKKISELGILQQVKNQYLDCVSSIFLTDKENKKHRISLDLKSFNKTCHL